MSTALFEVGVVKAVDHDVGDVRESVGAPQVFGGVGGERLEWVVSLDPAGLQVVGAARADGDRAVLGRAHQQESDVGVSAERWDQVGVALLDLLGAQPALLLHQVDEAEVAGAQHNGVLVAHPVLLMLAAAAGRLVKRLPDRGVVLVAAAHTPHLSPRE